MALHNDGDAAMLADMLMSILRLASRHGISRQSGH